MSMSRDRRKVMLHRFLCLGISLQFFPSSLWRILSPLSFSGSPTAFLQDCSILVYVCTVLTVLQDCSITVAILTFPKKWFYYITCLLISFYNLIWFKRSNGYFSDTRDWTKSSNVLTRYVLGHWAVSTAHLKPTLRQRPGTLPRQALY